MAHDPSFLKKLPIWELLKTVKKQHQFPITRPRFANLYMMQQLLKNKDRSLLKMNFEK